MVICLFRYWLGIDLRSLGDSFSFLCLIKLSLLTHKYTSSLTFARPILPLVLLGQGRKPLSTKNCVMFHCWPTTTAVGQPATNTQKNIMYRAILNVALCMQFNRKMSLDTSNMFLETHLFCRLEKYMDVVQSIKPKLKWKVFSKKKLVS